ncbi:hypothetical protein O3G_MSEX015068 [Manduca sexta]|uniref:Uncharacterized protein n=1 Tax=Manduca sexta TaxID=7130 RepID=A0A922D128_MANSE|nr:hypothetical protein O3G_MSEX015068 [Manduca sexta]KAG6465308.1 hypothetical protein O3G_MSEX015068 [Manduca sexta]
MSQILIEFIALCLICVVTGSNDIKDEGDRGAHSDRGALWFGPRLGKRSLKLSSEDDRQAFFRLLESADTLKYYYDQLPYYERQIDEPAKVTKKVIFTPKLGRSLDDSTQEKRVYENFEFTPRLGRRISEDMPATPSDQEYPMYHPDPEQIDTRTRYFSPRLGRTHFSPRLGRELSYDMPTNVRVARSTNKTLN